MTRREILRYLTALATLHLRGQNRTSSSSVPHPDTFKIYTDSPRLLLRPQRLKLLRRERERTSPRWEQFEALWAANTAFPELPWVQALRFQIADDRDAAARAVAWAVGPADTERKDDVRQMAIIADWCESLISGDDKRQLFLKIERAVSDTRPVLSVNEARSRVFAAVAISEEKPAVSQKALEAIFESFWNGVFIPALRDARARLTNDDAYAMLEIIHVIRDNLNFDLRETLPAWFRQYPLAHLLAHYPAPWPGAENEFHIPADEKIEATGPDLRKAALSRAAELAMVAYDSNAASSQLLQGWLMNDRFLMRGSFGLPYEFLWANPYQPGLSYYHAPLVVHDEMGGQLFVRSSWEDDAEWAGFFGGQLQLFRNGEVTHIDPAGNRGALDLDAAVVLFARESKKFEVPNPAAPAERAGDVAVFVVGLDPRKAYHVEVDGEEMIEALADPGGIVYLPSVPPGGVRVRPVPFIS